MSRKRLLKQLDLVTQSMIQGGLSSTTRTCGQSSCPCHSDPARRHGPNLYLTWRSQGKSHAWYIPPEHAHQAQAAQAAWACFGEIGCQIAVLNREQFRKRWSRNKSRSAGKASRRNS